MKRDRRWESIIPSILQLLAAITKSEKNWTKNERRRGGGEGGSKGGKERRKESAMNGRVIVDVKSGVMP